MYDISGICDGISILIDGIVPLLIMFIELKDILNILMIFDTFPVTLVFLEDGGVAMLECFLRISIYGKEYCLYIVQFGLPFNVDGTSLICLMIAIN